jgi:hypothetical protein
MDCNKNYQQKDFFDKHQNKDKNNLLLVKKRLFLWVFGYKLRFIVRFSSVEGSGEDGKVHLDPVLPEVPETVVLFAGFRLTENRFRFYGSFSSLH